MSHSSLPSRRRELQGGSAYIVSLLVLLVVSIIGLSLSLITQTEMQVGANERVLQRVFYATDAGIAAATAKGLVSADYSAQVFTVPDVDTAAIFQLRQQVDVSPFYPILTAPCNLCEINNVGQYGTKQYYKITHGVTVLGQRMGGGSTEPIAEKMISAMVDVQPTEASVESYLPVDDPDQLKKIVF